MDIRDLPEEEQRRLIVENARTMMGIPWVHMGRARGGLDCGGVPLRDFFEVGLIEESVIHTPFYAKTFMLHSDEERFVGIVEEFCRRVERPGFAPINPDAPLMPARPSPEAMAKDGDIVLFRVGKVVAHCAIVDKWPRIIHAHSRLGCVDYADASKGEEASRFVGVWTFKGWT